MNTPYTGSQAEFMTSGGDIPNHDNDRAVSWGAIFAGATGAAALSLILLILGVGLGLSSVSPWASSGMSATSFGISTIAWLAFVQIAASGMGGYLAGRLRARWIAAHADETYFRDTAHGFLAWGVATLITATVLASAVGNIVGGAAQAGTSVASGIAGVAGAGGTAVAAKAEMPADGDKKAGADTSGALDYWVDSLFRRTAVVDAATATSTASVAPPDGSAPTNTEAARILATSVSNGRLSPEDTTYLAQLVSQRTGVSQADAQARVTQTYNSLQAKLQASKDATQKAADAARKASAYASLWLFVSLLIGAFTASLAATLGGRQRDI